MAKKSNLELIVQILLLAAVVFFGISITKALDRNRQATAALHKELEAMKQGFSAPQKTAVLPTAETSELAQYFPDSSIAVSGELRTAIASDVGSLNPVTGNEAAAQSIIGMCTAPLGARSFARPEKFVPLIAETWSVSPDGKTINIKLRKNVL